MCLNLQNAKESGESFDSLQTGLLNGYCLWWHFFEDLLCVGENPQKAVDDRALAPVVLHHLFRLPLSGHVGCSQLSLLAVECPNHPFWVQLETGSLTPGDKVLKNIAREQECIISIKDV